MLFCLDDLDKKKHRDVINSLKIPFFLDITWDSNPHYRAPCMHPPIHFAYILILPSYFTL